MQNLTAGMRMSDRSQIFHVNFHDQYALYSQIRVNSDYIFENLPTLTCLTRLVRLLVYHRLCIIYIQTYSAFYFSIFDFFPGNCLINRFLLYGT